MKQIIIFCMASAIAFSSLSQTINPFVHSKAKEKTVRDAIPGSDIQSTKSRAFGDTIWSDNFTDPGKWVIFAEGDPDRNWVIGTDGPTGSFSSKVPIVQSTSGGNFAMFDSDGLGQGNQDASIKTNTSIDCSAYEYVAVKFQQSFRKWETTKTYVGVSTDNGTTWTDFEVNAAVPVSGYGEKYFQQDISSAAGKQAQVIIRFHYKGDWDYVWMVDDIAVVEGAGNEISIQQSYANYQGTGLFTYLPKNQIYGITTDTIVVDSFRVDFLNNGAKQQTNIIFNLNITDGTTPLYSNSTTPLASLNSLKNDSLFMVASPAVKLPAEKKDIYFIYNVTQNESDAYVKNNTDTIFLHINDSIFGRDRKFTTAIGPQRFNDGVTGDGVGTAFWIANDDSVSSASFFVHPATTPGITVIAKLYRAVGDGTTEKLIESEEYVIKPTDPGKWITIPFFKFENEHLITGGSWYLIMIHGFYGSADIFYIGADNTPTHSFPNSVCVMLAGETNWSWASTGVPMVRLNTGTCCWGTTGINENENTSFYISQNYPNPFSDLTQIEYRLDHTARVSTEVFDMTGKKVMQQDEGLQLAGEHTITLNAKELGNGIYYYTIHAGEFSRTGKMVLIKE